MQAHAADLGEDDDFDAAAPPRDGEGWRAFVRGTVGELRARPATRSAARAWASPATCPRGSGLSSSAALSTALALALLALADEPEGDRRELARLCSRVENDWVGAQTGLLDQLAALFGREGHALRLDCRDLSIEPVALDLRGWTLAVAPSGHEHVHAGSGYNDRRAECRAACEALGIASLRDAPARRTRPAAGAAGSPRAPRPQRERARRGGGGRAARRRPERARRAARRLAREPARRLRGLGRRRRAHGGAAEGRRRGRGADRGRRLRRLGARALRRPGRRRPTTPWSSSPPGRRGWCRPAT